MLDEVRQQLLAVDGVLVWVNPLDDGLTRTRLDPMLRAVASKGPWVSAHPEVVLKMGVREIPASDEASRLGGRYAPLPQSGRVSRRVSGFRLLRAVRVS